MVSEKSSDEFSIDLNKESIVFGDPIWDSTLAFISNYYQPNEKILVPEDFYDLFSNVYSYPHSYSESPDFFDWILIHKGKLSELSSKFLINLIRTNSVVLANEVFVVFSFSKTVQKAAFDGVHVRSLIRSIGQVTTHRLVEKVTSFDVQAKLGWSSQSDRQPPLFMERQSDQKAWFPYDENSPVIPLAWAATTKQQPFANLGDALSPIVISALSGLPTVHCSFQAPRCKLASVGTIAHGIKNGVVHVWGTGIDPNKYAHNLKEGYYAKPKPTQYQVHAVRGPRTAQTLRSGGVKVPDIYGDPIWFLPAIIAPAPVKKYELGIVVHLSELTGLSDKAGTLPELLRYHIPESIASSIRIISTITQPTFTDLERRTQEITACKRIVSTSLHGLVIAETYGIPCAFLWDRRRGATFANLNADADEERIDSRMRDFYGGVGRKKLFVYGQPRTEPTPWESVMRSIDAHWQPIEWSPQAFLDSFPLPLTFNPLEGKRFENRSLLQQIKL